MFHPYHIDTLVVLSVSRFPDGSGEVYGKNLVLMQFTGLLDKNGKEIYCGDIVKGYFDTNEVEDYIWLSLTDEEKKNGWKLFKIDMDIVEFARQQLPEELEVIGNIYENPNFLSEKEEWKITCKK